MLRRIHIDGFKSLADTEVRLAPVVVLLGPNAAGKSNFLEAILLLSRVVTQRTLTDAFEGLRGYPHESFALPDRGVEGLLDLDTAALSFEADVEPLPRAGKNGGDALRYRVGIRTQPATGSLEVVDEYLSRLTRRLQPKGSPRIEPVDFETGGKLAIRQLGGAGRPTYQPLGLAHTVASNPQYSGATRYPDFDRLRNELGSWNLYYLDPRVSMREPQAPRETEDIGRRGELIAPFLYRLKEHEDLRRYFDAVRRAVHAAVPSIEEIDVDLDKKRGTLDIQVRQSGTLFSSRIISEGTLRILALCALAGNPWGVSLVAFEEPENGVHPRRIEVIADLLLSMAASGSTQVIVTTHSPTLVAAMARRMRAGDDDMIGLLRCSQVGRLTRISPFDSIGDLFEDQEIVEALTSGEDGATVAAMLKGGWLDG
jgi:predicted ATPase